MPEYYTNPNGDSWPYRYFTKKEMVCKCGCGGLPSHRFMQALESLRSLCGFPFIVSSGFRCPEYNSKVSKSGRNGPHTKGAADILISGPLAFVMVAIAMNDDLMTGIGVHQKGPMSERFIHVDNLPDGEQPRPRLWSY